MLNNGLVTFLEWQIYSNKKVKLRTSKIILPMTGIFNLLIPKRKRVTNAATIPKPDQSNVIV